MYSISQLQTLSGIKAHTIRIWEQRYAALHPSRSEGNTRYYDDTQLRRLLNIASLLNTGHKVSDLCSMKDRELSDLLEEQFLNEEKNDDSSEYFISQLIAAALNFDETHFEKIFSNCILRLGLKNTYIQIIYPLLNRIGLMWASDTMSPASEHFAVNLIKQKILAATDTLPPAKNSKSNWLLFLPENEYHEIGLLFAQFILRESGQKVVYLGGNVPLGVLESAVKKINPTHLFFFLVHNNLPEDTQEYLESLKKSFSERKLYISGNRKLISQLKLGKEFKWVQSVDTFEKEIITFA